MFVFQITLVTGHQDLLPRTIVVTWLQSQAKARQTTLNSLPLHDDAVDNSLSHSFAISSTFTQFLQA